MLDEEEILRLMSAREQILRDFDPNDVTPYLRRFLTEDDIETVKNEVTRTKRCAVFLDKFQKKANGLQEMMDIFRENGQHHLANLLSSTTTDGASVPRRNLTEAQLCATLIRAKVPTRPEHYVERPLQLNRLKSALRNLRQPGWVILHGLGGCGKTTLAAECLRDTELVSQNFGREVEFVRFHSEMLVIFKNLHCKIARRNSDISDRKFRDIDSAMDAVQQLIYEKYPTMLIVLDDVWSRDVIRCFDGLGCRILATTRNPVLFKVTAYPKVFVPVEPIGFNDKEARDVLAKFSGKEAEDLPLEAGEIIKMADGLPLVISLVGSLVAEHPDRWSLYCEEMKDQKMDAIANESAYAHDSLHKAVCLSYDDLSEELKDKFRSLVVFPLELPIPDQILVHYWNVHPEESWSKRMVRVQDTVKELVGRSLITVGSRTEGRRRQHSGDIQPRCYVLHKLVHMQLKRKICSDKERRNCHKILIERLKAARNKGNLVDEAVVEEHFCRFLAYHLCWGRMQGIFSDYYLNVRELSRMLKYITPSDLIADFLSLKKRICRFANEERYAEILRFLQRNAKDLANGVSLIQLALQKEAQNTWMHNEAMNVVASLKTSDPSLVFLESRSSCADEEEVCPAFSTFMPLSCSCVRFLGSKSEIFAAAAEDRPLIYICSSQSGQVFREIKLPSVAKSLSSWEWEVFVCCEKLSKVMMFIVDMDEVRKEREVSSQDSVTPSPLLRHCSRSLFAEEEAGMDSERAEDESEEPDASFEADPCIEEGFECCVVSGDGRLVAACSSGENRKVYVWMTASQKESSILQPEISFLMQNGAGDQKGDFEVRGAHSPGWVQFSPDSGFIMAAWKEDRSVSIWEANSKVPKFVIKHEGVCVSPRFLRDREIVTVSPSELKFWRLETDGVTEFKMVKFDKPGSLPHCVETTNNGRYIIIGCTDYGIYVYDVLENVSVVRILRSHCGIVLGLALSCDDEFRMISCGTGNCIFSWDMGQVLTKSENVNRIRRFDCVWEEDGNAGRAEIDSDGTLSVKMRGRDFTDIKGVTAAGFSHNAMLLFLGFCKGTMKVLSCASGEVEILHEDHGAPVYDFAVSESGNLVCGWDEAGHVKGNVLIGQSSEFSESGRLIRCFKFSAQSEIISVRFATLRNPDGFSQEWIVVGTKSNGVQVFVPDSGDDEKIFFLCEQDAPSVLCSDTHSDLVVAAFCQDAKIWQLNAVEHGVLLWSSQQECIRTCTFSKSGQFLAFGQDNGSICLYCLPKIVPNMSSLELEFRWKIDLAHSSWVTHLAFAASETTVMSAGRSLKFWSLEDKKQLGVIPFTGQSVRNVYFDSWFGQFCVVDSFGKPHWLYRM